MQSAIWSYVILVAMGGILACDRTTLGQNRCLKLPGYGSKYQCATCLSNAYSSQKTKGKYGCTESARYCWFQCMVEKHDLARGPVYSDCECNPHEPFPQPSVILPPSCYSPDGTDCDWYRQCLYKTFPCSGHQVAQSTRYGETFCNLHDDSTLKFSQTVLWINAVRKCFQVSLVPLLHVCQARPSCENVQTTALESHSTCYKSPYQGSSVCSISTADWLRLFWTIKASFASSEFVEILKSSVATAASCGGAYGTHIGDRLYSIEAWAWDTAMEKCETWSDDQLAHAIVHHISSSLNWDKLRDVTSDWYAFAIAGQIKSPPVGEAGRGLKIQLFVEDREDIGLNVSNSPNRRRLNQTIAELEDAVARGMTGTVTYYHYGVTSLLKCTSGGAIDNGCRLATEVAVGPAINFTSVTEPPPCTTTTTTTTTARPRRGTSGKSANVGASASLVVWLFTVAYGFFCFLLRK